MANQPRFAGLLVSSRQTRRRASQVLAVAAGSALLGKAGLNSAGLFALAQEVDNEDSPGRGRGRGRGGDDDDSVSGNADDRGSELEQAVEIPPGSIEIRIIGDDAGDFVPAELTVDVGQSVTFVNVHSDEHTATGSGFDTGIIPDEGGSATVVLDTPGAFPYACQIHPEMTGVIRVRDEEGVVPETETTLEEIPPDAAAVSIANLAFDPADITSATGTTVAWTNNDAVPHTVTSSDGLFDSGIFDPGANFAFTFNEPGSFSYFCQLHPQMRGTVIAEGEVVTDAQEAAPPVDEPASATPSANETLAEATAPAASAIPGPDGVWLIELSPDGDADFGPHRALVAFHSDGMLEADLAAAPGVGASPRLLTSGHGEWIVRDYVWTITLAALMTDADERFAGTITFAGEGQIAADGSSLEGTFDVTVVDADDGTIGESTGTFRGERLPLDP